MDDVEDEDESEAIWHLGLGFDDPNIMGGCASPCVCLLSLFVCVVFLFVCVGGLRRGVLVTAVLRLK